MRTPIKDKGRSHKRSSTIAKTPRSMWAYFDTSALARRYIDEAGHAIHSVMN